MSFWYNLLKKGYEMKSKISLSKKPVAEQTEQVEETEQEVQAQPEVVVAKESKSSEVSYSHEALSLYKNKFDEWVLVSLKFNPNGDVRPSVEELSVHSDRVVASERYRIEVINRGIL